MRFQLPPETVLSVFSLRHSDLVVIVLGLQPTLGGKVVMEVDCVDSQQVDYTSEIRKLPGVLSVFRLGARQFRTRFRMVAAPPRFLTAALRIGAVFRYPVVVRNGQCTIVVEASAQGLRRMMRELRRLAEGVKVLSWGRESLPTFPPSLSSRQQGLLYQAIAAGYFDVPRRITLTALAGQVHRSKSSVSRALSLIENRIVEASVLATI